LVLIVQPVLGVAVVVQLLQVFVAAELTAVQVPRALEAALEAGVAVAVVAVAVGVVAVALEVVAAAADKDTVDIAAGDIAAGDIAAGDIAAGVAVACRGTSVLGDTPPDLLAVAAVDTPPLAIAASLVVPAVVGRACHNQAFDASGMAALADAALLPMAERTVVVVVVEWVVPGVALVASFEQLVQEPVWWQQVSIRVVWHRPLRVSVVHRHGYRVAFSIHLSISRRCLRFSWPSTPWGLPRRP